MGKWIPVTKRLPKHLQQYYATCKSITEDRENWVIEGTYNCEFGGWQMTPYLANGWGEIIAWMPKKMPKPYEGE